MKRRSLLHSLIYLPTLTRLLLPNQPQSGTIHFNCDLSDSAFAAFYFPGPCTLAYQWGYIANGNFFRQTLYETIPYEDEVAFWFGNGGYQQLQELVWYATGPASVTFATCVL